jgi:hypothetical protein
VDSTVDLDFVAKKKDPSPCRESNPGRPAHSVVILLTELSRLTFKFKLNGPLSVNVIHKEFH